MLRITIVSFALAACTVGEDQPGVHVGDLDGSDGGTCPTGDCEPHQSPPATTGGGSGSGSGSSVYALTNDTNGCTTNIPDLPAGCTIYRGDVERGAPEWLNCWYQAGWPSPFTCTVSVGLNASCDLSDDAINATVGECKTKQTDADRILCAMDAIQAWEGPDGVCRHFSRCFKKVYEAMGFSQSVVTRWMGGLFGDGHAFNIVETPPRGRYFVDAYNDIMYWCP